MLRFLSITDFALIDRIDLEFGAGFNVLTGETGAGKSIIVDALGLLLGGRADGGLIRTGAAQTRVEGVFVPTIAARSQIEAVLQMSGIETNGDELVLAREVNLEGRNLCRINGRLVPLKLVNSVTDHLVDVHGQGQHLSLFRVRGHIDLLDRFAGLDNRRKELTALVGHYRHVMQKLYGSQDAQRDAAQRLDLLQYQVQEIHDARLWNGEEETLETQRIVAANTERLSEIVEQTYDALYNGGEGQAAASELLARAATALGTGVEVDPSLEALREMVDSLVHSVEDAARSLRDYKGSIDMDPARLEDIEERRDLIFRLKRKYGDTVEDVLRFGQQAASEIETLSSSAQGTEELVVEAEKLLTKMGTLAGELSQSRSAAAVDMGKAAELILSELAMGAAKLKVDIQRKKSPEGVPVPKIDAGNVRFAFDSKGIDRVELMLSANPSEPMKPLAQVASGGEASRLMLAIKAVLSEADAVPTLVFDELDAGIGGRVGTTVGRKLWGLAENHQVLCVTHLPQIACFADRHLQVSKDTVDGHSSIRVESIHGKDQAQEINAMLGASGAASKRNAFEMLEATKTWKRKNTTDSNPRR